MTRPPDTDRVRRVVEGEWGLSGATVTPHEGGMNSATWLVTRGDERWVAKAAEVGAGLAVATAVERAGIPAGAPVRPMVRVAGMPLALLSLVPGRELTAAEAPLVGATLAAVHRALRGVAVPGERPFLRVDVKAAHFDVRPQLRPLVAAAVAAVAEPAGAWTTGLLHSDPAPGAFLLADRVGLIDWDGGIRGPLLYDLASAVMYSGPGVVGPYLAGGALTEAEAEAGLELFLRFRFAVQADYFCRRTARNDLTGIESPAGNRKGLDDAERLLRDPNPLSRPGEKLPHQP